jgi:ferric-dicitrate binding protein FerR (iron transport regulator)
MKRLKNINTEPVKAWTVGELSFHNTTLAEIVKVLERRFDVQITVSNEKLASDKFTCHFSNDVTIEQIMHNLKDTKRLSYKINNRKIEITDYL